MIIKRGPREWENVHLTEKTQLADLIFIDNSGSAGGFDVLKQTARDLENVIREAHQSQNRIRALGSGWALSDIAITDGWLINTKALNGCFDVSDKYFEDGYETQKRQHLIIAQCGISVGELNVYLEVARHSGTRRALKTAGVGAGQTIAGAVSGHTHGAAINFGSIPDYVVGIQLVNGTGRSYWIERETCPVLNDNFIAKLESTAIRDDDVFNSTLVSFGAFGVITALALETSPIYQLEFSPVREVSYQSLKDGLASLASADINSPKAPYHYEFIFNPYNKKKIAIEASAIKVEYEAGHETPKPVWIIRDKRGFAPGEMMPKLFLNTFLLSSRRKADIQFKQYRKSAILDNVRGTPGQLFTATLTYLEGYTESALAVSINDIPKMLEICIDVIKRLKIPCISQVRLVHPTEALLGFTLHTPKTAVFEFGLINDDRFPLLEKTLRKELTASNVSYTFHWSKNSGIDNATLLHMYGTDRVFRWKAARDRLFDNNDSLKKVFNNAHLERAGLT